ncbi:hypothetical protein [Lentzea terrae]|uniref:hypothetical protein n=1 Tax=Lentzea terrae TaxID=2200761 RepID=UPI000DD2C67A|nr:hypothetical protein [Lentzea terrae]
MTDPFDEADANNPGKDDAKLTGKALAKGAASLIPGGGIAVELFNGWEERKRRRETAMIQEVLKLLNEGVDQVKARLDSDDELAALWERALDAARSTRIERLRMIYAGIMAGAVYEDHNSRMQANVLVRVLDRLDEEHLQVIAAINIEAQKPPTMFEDGSPAPAGAQRHELDARLPHLSQVLDILLTSLLSDRIIEDALNNTWAAVRGDRRYTLSQIGQIVLEKLSPEA